jgi:hypothetical protein
MKSGCGLIFIALLKVMGLALLVVIVFAMVKCNNRKFGNKPFYKKGLVMNFITNKGE